MEITLKVDNNDFKMRPVSKLYIGVSHYKYNFLSIRYKFGIAKKCNYKMNAVCL